LECQKGYTEQGYDGIYEDPHFGKPPSQECLEKRHEYDGGIFQKRCGGGARGPKSREFRSHHRKKGASEKSAAHKRFHLAAYQGPPENTGEQEKGQAKTKAQQIEYAHVFHADFCKQVGCAACQNYSGKQEFRQARVPLFAVSWSTSRKAPKNTTSIDIIILHRIF